MTDPHKLLIYVHFNIKNGLDRFVIDQLDKVTPEFDDVIIISNSALNEHNQKKLSKYTNNIIQRGNTGYDFAAWRDGMKSIGFDKLQEYDSITLMNDTCIGPVYPIQEMYNKFADTDTDFWGMIVYPESATGMPDTDGPLPKHLQSFFLVFNNNIISSDIFKKFWSNIQDFTEVNDVIRNYETQMTKTFENAGFTSAAFFDPSNYIQENNIREARYNFTINFPILLLENRCPLVKRKVFLGIRNLKKTLGVFRFVQRNTTYKIGYFSPTFVRALIQHFIKVRIKKISRLFSFIKKIIRRLLPKR